MRVKPADRGYRCSVCALRIDQVEITKVGGEREAAIRKMVPAAEKIQIIDYVTRKDVRERAQAEINADRS